MRPKVGHVTGRVLYRGAPVPAGWVQFRPADPARNAVSAELDADGNFSADLPAGEVTVAIDNREWEPQPAGIPSLPPGIPLSPEARAQPGPAPPAPKAGGERRGASRAGKYVPIRTGTTTRPRRGSSSRSRAGRRSRRSS